MLSRRGVLSATVSAAVLPAIPNTLLAQEAVQPTSAETPRSQLTPTEQLMYSTVRLVNQTGNELHTGTGFIFNFFSINGQGVPAIVTNRHVVNGLNKCNFSLASRLADGSPDLDKHILVEISDLPNKFISHPSVDLVIQSANF